MDDIPQFPDCDPNELSLDDAFGTHDIEYWVWSGTQLVPASPEQVALLREYEAMWRLEYWQRSEQRMSARAEREWPTGRPWRWPSRALAACGRPFQALRLWGRAPAETMPRAAAEPTCDPSPMHEQSAL